MALFLVCSVLCFLLVLLAASLVCAIIVLLVLDSLGWDAQIVLLVSSVLDPLPALVAQLELEDHHVLIAFHPQANALCALLVMVSPPQEGSVKSAPTVGPLETQSANPVQVAEVGLSVFNVILSQDCAIQNVILAVV